MAPYDGQFERLDIQRYSDSPLYNTKAVVQLTGIPAPTLRAWERRYEILSPERGDNTYRLYSERDIAIIRWLKAKIDSGMAISQAIALFRHMLEKQGEQAEEDFGEHTPGFHILLSPTNDSETVVAPPPADDLPELHAQRGTVDYQQLFKNYPSLHNMQVVRGHLLQAFKSLDEAMAQTLLTSMLAIYPVEQVCTDLITPTLWQIGQLWEERKITVSVEHFASAFFRGILTNLLHITSGPETGSLTIVCCAPGEAHELAALMLALFLRRAGVRVVYLGQSIEIAGLIEISRQLEPLLICVSLTMPAFFSALIDLGRRIEEMPEPRPLFTFGGQVFISQPHLISQVPGTYVPGDFQSIVGQLKRMIAAQEERRRGASSSRQSDT